MNAKMKYRCLVRAAMIDGQLTSSEKEMLALYASQLNLSEGDVRDVLLGPDRHTEIVPPADPEERSRLFMDIAGIVMADDHISPEEKDYLLRLGDMFEIDRGEVIELISGI